VAQAQAAANSELSKLVGIVTQTLKPSLAAAEWGTVKQVVERLAFLKGMTFRVCVRTKFPESSLPPTRVPHISPRFLWGDVGNFTALSRQLWEFQWISEVTNGQGP
jgi:hypothetical protein